MTTQDVVLQHEAGLHARPAADFVKAASGFTATISVQADAKRANAKSIIQVMGLGARQGTTITISAEGADEAEAVAALVARVERNFAAE